MTRRTTGHDVARLAGVSQATVSRALRNVPGTSPATRQAVIAAASQLDYFPSDQGRSLVTRTTGRIAVVVEELTNPFYPELVEPIRRALGARGLKTVLVSDRRGRDDPADLLRQLGDGTYDGVVLTTTRRRDRLPWELRRRGIPHVLVNRVTDQLTSPSCSVDNAAAAQTAADFVLGLGHTTIAAIHGPVDTSTGHERATALEARLAEHGRPLSPAATRRAHDYSHDSGLRLARELLAARDRPSAIVCANDVLAFGALSAAAELGVVVPDDLTVVGCDDIAMSAWPALALTTVRCELSTLAETGVRMLLDAIAGDPGVRLERLPVTLVTRSTHRR